MYELYIGNKNYSSWSLRPWLLMRTLDIGFSEKLVQFDADPVKQNFKSFSPTGRVPCLIDDEVVVWDSLAIVEYLAERHPGVWPTDAVARAWARSSSAEMHSSFGTLRNICGMNCGIRVKLNVRSPALLADIARIDELWTEGLDRFGGPYLVGGVFTAVDAFYAPVTFRAQTYGLEFGRRASAYRDMILALPAMREWYEAGLAETWRDEPHEQEARASGAWTADLRATG